MPGIVERLAADRRRKVLELLDEGGLRLPEGSLKTALRHIFDDGIGRDDVRVLIEFLERHGLVRVERMAQPGTAEQLWVAVLCEAGQAVARGRRHVGVAERDAA